MAIAGVMRPRKTRGRGLRPPIGAAIGPNFRPMSSAPRLFTATVGIRGMLIPSAVEIAARSSKPHRSKLAPKSAPAQRF